MGNRSAFWEYMKAAFPDRVNEISRRFGGQRVQIPLPDEDSAGDIRNASIRADRANGMTVKALMAKYSLGHQTITDILNMKTTPP